MGFGIAENKKNLIEWIKACQASGLPLRDFKFEGGETCEDVKARATTFI